LSIHTIFVWHGPLTATAMVAAIGNGAAFSRGRDFGAWLGLYRSKSRLATGRFSAESAGAGTQLVAGFGQSRGYQDERGARK
jgi:transposase